MTATAVRERPILFSGPMVEAIMAGRKTQTRRLLKPQPELAAKITVRDADVLIEKWERQSREFSNFGRCENIKLYAQLGGLLWVREGLIRPDGDPWLYRADNQPVIVAKEDETAMVVWAHHKKQDYCPSMFMPRWASRIALEVTGVRVERVQDICEQDAMAEGAMFHDGRPIGHHGWRHDYNDVFPTAKHSFAYLWDLINSKKAPWASNPWVWVIAFKQEVGSE